MQRWFLVLLACLLEASVAAAQPFPSKPVRIINPFAAGGAPVAFDLASAHLFDPVTTRRIL